VLFLIGWFASGGDAPDYTAPDQAWATWAEDNQWKSRIGAFAMLLAGFVFLHYAGAIRSALGRAESSLRGSPQLAHVAFAGAITGMAADVSRSGQGGRRRCRPTSPIGSAGCAPPA
jgi:hypothetical protein